jgi:hypothetical protein
LPPSEPPLDPRYDDYGSAPVIDPRYDVPDVGILGTTDPYGEYGSEYHPPLRVDARQQVQYMANARVSQQQARQQRHFTDRPIYDQPSLHPRHGAATAPPDDYYVDDQHVEDYLYSRDHDHDKRQNVATMSTDSSTESSGQSGSFSGSGSQSSSGKSGESSQREIRPISPMSLNEMRRKSRQMGHETQWLRVVHSGYGLEAWRQGARDRGFFLVCSLSSAEGMYVQIPPRSTVEQVVDVLLDVNMTVRRQTRYKDMNRSNKSRLQIKCEPFIVPVSNEAKPKLVRTTRFHCGGQDDETYKM